MVSRGNHCHWNQLCFCERLTGGGLHFRQEMCLKCLIVAWVQLMGNECYMFCRCILFLYNVRLYHIFCYNLAFYQSNLYNGRSGLDASPRMSPSQKVHASSVSRTNSSPGDFDRSIDRPMRLAEIHVAAEQAIKQTTSNPDLLKSLSSIEEFEVLSWAAPIFICLIERFLIISYSPILINYAHLSDCIFCLLPHLCKKHLL